MYCPGCGSSQSEELKFCKSCGANLSALRQVLATRETSEKFDWSKTWVAEMFQSAEEAQRRKAELDRQRGHDTGGQALHRDQSWSDHCQRWSGYRNISLRFHAGPDLRRQGYTRHCRDP